ncbi:MAG: LPS export ABC transporter permease LptG [candidate division Zixibacteria bacterium]|nr:LPS export ABC transporter permease LptG [candidate division Zixibacteria bacterium]
MSILDKYILRQFRNALLFLLLAVWIVFLLVDLINQLDKFMDQHASLFLVIKYYFFYSPYIIVLTLPIVVLLATLLSVGQLSRKNEITAMKSVGISLYRILLPILAMGLVISLVIMVAGVVVLPYTDEKKLEVKRVEIEKGTPYAGGNLYNLLVQDQSGAIFSLERYNSQKKFGTDVLVQKFRDGHLLEEIRAQKMSWTGNGWLLEKGRYRILPDSLNQSFPEKTFDRLLRLDFNIKPEAFTKREKMTEEMSFKELADYINAKKETKQEVPKELTDLYFKISYPFISLILVLLAAPLAANPRRSGLAISFALGLFISFAYYILLQIFRSLGYNQKLTPFLAAWLANIIFLIVGMVILMKVEK